MPTQSVNPTIGDVLEDFSAYAPQQVESILNRALIAFSTQNSFTISVGSVCMNRVANILTEEADVFAGMMTKEMGKTVASAKLRSRNVLWCVVTVQKMTKSTWLTN